jgi:hypothetical protein
MGLALGAAVVIEHECGPDSVASPRCLSPCVRAVVCPWCIRRKARQTVVMATWVGLIGVLAGALIAFGGQFLMRRSERQERNETLLLEQCALIIALSQDYRNRVWEERHQVASDVVSRWDIGTYRLAEARLQLLSREPKLWAALEALHKSGVALGKAWRLGSSDEAGIDSAWAAHRDAVDRFIDVGFQTIRQGPARSNRRQHVDAVSQ